ncbi:MAG: TetR/AcrR family transcriptional regulator [Clostridia bacterium]|nr:TetR/AcrR family transcriptional regulator [Clostridia bacterium]
MARRIEGVSDKLICCAREEFMEMGFQDASLRVIAAKAGTSPCSIYTRFRDKEGLFHALVGEVVEDFLEWFLREQAAFDDRSVEAKTDVLDYAGDKFVMMVDYLYDHYDVFRLLVRCADIDCYENMMDRLIAIDNEYAVRYMTSTGHDAIASGRMSPELLHMLASAYYSGLFETIRHEMPREKAHVYVRQLRRFFVMGWADLLQIEKG